MTGDKSRPENQDDGSPRHVEQGTSTIEWIAAALGGLMFVTMIGYMAFLGLNKVDGPPIITLAAKEPIKTGNDYLVPFVATNRGEATAAGLIVTATLTKGTTEVESAEITIDYLPGGSDRSGGFIFGRDPSGYSLELSAKAYLDP